MFDFIKKYIILLFIRRKQYMNALKRISPQNAALEIMKDMWVDKKYPIDPVWISRNLGIKVIESELPEEVSGALIKDVGKDPIIVLSKSDSKNRKRFSCAHELGHYIYRMKNGEDHFEYIDYRNHIYSYGNKAEEIFANQFAASLLMPDSAIKEEIKKLPAFLLGKHFGVSDDAMNIRLKDLGLK
jgi:Zn-dependent peptidase ImmA (M78 family)